MNYKKIGKLSFQCESLLLAKDELEIFISKNQHLSNFTKQAIYKQISTLTKKILSVEAIIKIEVTK